MLKFENLKIKKAKSFKDKLIGLMFKKNINYGLVFYNTKAIHTFFMKQNIDIIFTDKNDNILKIYKNVKKRKIIIGPFKTKYTYELPNGTINCKK